MVKSSQETMWWKVVVADMSIGKPFRPILNTTLNEKHNILPEEHVAEGVYPTLKYYAIGLGQESMFDNTNKYKFSYHQAINGALFDQIPFVMKTADEDLDNLDKLKYRFRKSITVNGVEYFAYYLKECPYPDSRDFLTEIVVSGDEEYLNVFNSSTDSILNPTPINKQAMLDSPSDSEYINKIIDFTFSMTKTEVDNLLDVFDLLDLDASHINEIAICSGSDITLENGLTEAIDVQTAFICDTSILLATDMLEDDKIDLKIEVGGSEPLFKKNT